MESTDISPDAIVDTAIRQPPQRWISIIEDQREPPAKDLSWVSTSDESASELELVCESRNMEAGATRAFVLFRFLEVRHFVWRRGEAKELNVSSTTFVARAVRGTCELGSIRTKKLDNLCTISLALGHRFGDIEVRCDDVKHELVQLYAKARGPNAWDYFELGTNRPVDFYNPFGRPWASVSSPGASSTKEATDD